MKGALRRIVLEVVGWGLVVGGIAALILPGPGLLMLAGGLVVLSQQYEWAERRVEPVKREAMRGAAASVASWPRIVVSCLGIAGLLACAVLWFEKPDVPGWYPLPDWLWLPGGKATSITLVLSAVLAAVLLVWSYRRFHDNPEAVAEVNAAARSDDGREHFFGG